MHVVFASDMVPTITAWANAALPDEAVALLLGEVDAQGWHVRHLHPAINVAPNPRRFFVLDPVAWLTADAVAQATGCAIIGVVHTHPVGEARPSLHDMQSGPSLGRHMLFTIWAREQGQPVLRAWRWDDEAFIEVPITCNH